MSWNQVWEDVFQNQSWGRYPDESFIRFIARNFYRSQDRSQVKILEVGCGSGANIWYLAREGFDTYGIDGSVTAIAQAKERLIQENLSAHLSVNDIIQLPYADGQFDAVGDNACLTCNALQNMPQILAEIERVLKPQGLFYSRTFTDKTSGEEKWRKMGFVESKTGDTDGKGMVRLMNKEEVQRMYGTLFQIISVDCREYAQEKEKINTSEWIICAQKK